MHRTIFPHIFGRSKKLQNEFRSRFKKSSWPKVGYLVDQLIDWIIGPSEYMRKMVLLIRLRPFVRPFVRSFPTILGNRSVDFSEIWHEASLMVPLKSDRARFLKKIICPG